MIKTTELMLGNLVEHKNDYVQVINLAYGDLMIRHNGIGVSVIESDINPIPLTEGIFKRLKVHCYGYKYVHEFQISMRNLDITPLLSPRYTTHDGVEVWEGDEVWYTFIHPKNSDTPQKWVVSVDMCNTRYLYFNFKEKAQSYIDSQTRKPIFTTEDGVDVFEGDGYWYVNKDGSKFFDGLDKVGFICANFSGRSGDVLHFSTEQLAQAYLNKVWAEKEYNDLISKK